LSVTKPKVVFNQPNNLKTRSRPVLENKKNKGLRTILSDQNRGLHDKDSDWGNSEFDVQVKRDSPIEK
jgi:hypothetical protein